MPEMTVHLIQCLCPERHCILAAAFEEPPGTIAEATETLKETIEELIVAGRIDAWCGLCQAGRETWTFEVRGLPGKSLAEMLPMLRQSEAHQRAVSAMMRAARQEQAEAKASRN